MNYEPGFGVWSLRNSLLNRSKRQRLGNYELERHFRRYSIYFFSLLCTIISKVCVARPRCLVQSEELFHLV